MLRKFYNYITVILLIAVIFISCKKWDAYKKYTAEGEKVYPGAASGVKALPGKERVLLTWIHGIDSRVTKYKVTWANGTDSILFDAASFKPGDTVKCYVDKLPESTYTFAIYSMDDKGNQSVSTEVPFITVYGPRYESTLLNRTVKTVGYAANTKMLTVVWGTPDTVNLATQISYTDTMGVAKNIILSATEDTSVFAWNLGSTIFYKSTYKPVSVAIDSFAVTHLDSIKVSNLPVPKNSWKIVTLPNDAVTNAYGTSLSTIWDGQPGGYPGIYHTDGAALPHHFTFDLGKIYNQLTKFAEWGRQDGAYHNPNDFEVWGIADITGAATTLPGNDPGWKAESIAKGWTLLTEVKRTDDGIAQVTTNLINNPPPVRFIRIRVLHTIDNDNASHMSEVSFWYNP
ncbi:MAG: DUF4998 domain-containing protein [Ferruginibacter sp.]